MEFPMDDIYQMIYSFQNDFALVILLFAVIFGFILSFAVGANDSANSWGTPVGAGTVSFGIAVIFGSIMETLGAMVLSGEVIQTISGEKSVVNMKLYLSDNSTAWDEFMRGEPYLVGEKSLMLGMLSSMVASQVWQLAATYLGWPVSGTHAIISSLMGFTLVEKGIEGINVGNANPFCASGIYKVSYGLFISLFLALIIGLVIYFFVFKFAIIKKNPRGLLNKIIYTSLVFLMFTAIGFTMATAKAFKEKLPVIIESESCMHPNQKIFGFLVGICCGAVVSIIFHFAILDLLMDAVSEFRLRIGCIDGDEDEAERIETRDNKEELVMHRMDSDNNVTTVQMDKMETEMDVASEKTYDEAPEIRNVFRPLQFIVACFAALNHGGNDVGNCIGPLVTIWFIYKSPLDFGSREDSLIWMAWGGIGISLGLLAFGKRVIMTMGTKITPMTPSLGFVVVLSASFVVMTCSLFGIPTSTTHCQVMALIGSGIARGFVDTGSLKGGLSTVDLKVFRNIFLSWIITIPCSLGISAAFYAVLRVSLIGSFDSVF